MRISFDRAPVSGRWTAARVHKQAHRTMKDAAVAAAVLQYRGE
jgi:hypothetical protein